MKTNELFRESARALEFRLDTKSQNLGQSENSRQVQKIMREIFWQSLRFRLDVAFDFKLKNVSGHLTNLTVFEIFGLHKITRFNINITIFTL